MGWLREIWQAFSGIFKWWFIVTPWDTAVRIRLGKDIRVFGAGIHFRLPYFDEVRIQNRRRRICSLGEQNLMTEDGKAVTLCGSVGYQIGDVLKLYQTLHHAEETIKLHTMGLITDYVINHNYEDVSPKRLVAYVQKRLDLKQFGLENVEFFLIHFVSVKTYRFITEGIYNYGSGNLSTGTQGPGNVPPPEVT